MKRLTIATITILAFLSFACITQAETFLNDRAGFDDALNTVTCIDFEGIATSGGQAGAVNLVGSSITFSGLTLTPGTGAEGLFVGIPDKSLSNYEDVNFFANNFFPTSGVACLSPDLTTAPAPVGIVHVEFDEPVNGVGGYFLDAEHTTPDDSYIEAFDSGGNSLGKLYLGNQGDDSQAFAGIVAAGIVSADLSLGYGSDGVGLDDLCYGRNTIELVSIDIKPISCPNSLNDDANGKLTVAILGTAELDVTTIDPFSVRLEGVEPIKSSINDVSTPVADPEYCECNLEGEDGNDDLILKFSTNEVVETLGEVDAGDELELILTGSLTDGTPIEGYDCVVIVSKGK